MSNDRHKEQFEKRDREPVSEQDFNEAMRAMLGPRTNVRSENKEPTAEELNRRYKLERKGQS
ncbi:MAG: hypothetical protein F4Z71_00140 [Gammaproteobacteria bacterium]|nr:hypothetical protein [Gammaproteobacteria bacterium]MYE31035.1 hypothetical protein [Gammaproteobacteria bacterium]